MYAHADLHAIEKDFRVDTSLFVKLIQDQGVSRLEWVQSENLPLRADLRSLPL